MKIIHICPRDPTEQAGIQIYIRNLTSYLNKSGIKSDILTTTTHKKKTVQLLGNTKIYYVPSFQIKIPIDILNEKNPLINIIPFLIKKRNFYDIYHIHSYAYFSSLEAIFLSKILNKPTVVTIHGLVQLFLLKRIPIILKLKLFLKSFYYRLIGKYVIDNCNILIACSKRDLLSIGKVFFSKRKSNNFWIPNGIEINPQHFTKTFERKYITFIGRLDYLKGFDQFLDMMEEINRVYPSIPIMIVGKGPLSSLIKQKSKTLNINYIPFVPHEKIHEIYLKSKMYVICSYSEATPTTILEAMAYNTPIVSSNVGGISDLIKDGLNGFVYDLNDINEGIRKILTLLNDKILQERFSKSSNKIVKKSFTWQRIIRNHKIIYKKILDKFL